MSSQGCFMPTRKHLGPLEKYLSIKINTIKYPPQHARPAYTAPAHTSHHHPDYWDIPGDGSGEDLGLHISQASRTKVPGNRKGYKTAVGHAVNV